MKYTKVLALLFLCAPHLQIQGIAINVSLGELADIDIVISKNALTDTSLASEPFDTSARILARYSCVQNIHNSVFLGNRIYSAADMPTLFLPEHRVLMPTVQQNTFSIELSPSDIAAMIGEDINEVCVRVRQRTYAYNPVKKQLEFFTINLLKEDMYNVNASLNLNTHGNIACEKFNDLPQSLQNTHAVAYGTVC